MRKQAVIVILLFTAGLAGCTLGQKPPDTANSTLQLVNPTINLSPTEPQEKVNQPTRQELTATGANQLVNQEEATTMEAIVKTDKGEFTITLDPKSAPETVKNFESKAKSNYYANLTFHRVEDWVVQGGDPLGTGTGGGQMPTELSSTPFKEGSVGVARGGNRDISNDSQFFVCTKDCSWLTGEYTNFGEVTKGMDVVKQIQKGDKILSITLQ